MSEKRIGYTLKRYRLPEGPPPPYHVNGRTSNRTKTDATKAANVSRRQTSRRADDRSQARMATTPGKKYGTKPKWRPTRKYLMFCTNQPAVSRLVNTC